MKYNRSVVYCKASETPHTRKDLVLDSQTNTKHNKPDLSQPATPPNSI